jgi:uncharacterized RDD family membrane protein YckC
MAIAAPPEVPESLEGHYAGPITRLLAATADGFIAFWVFNLLITLTVFFWDALTDGGLDAPENVALAWGAGMAVWLVFYNGVCWSVWWKSPGMGLLGIRVVNRDGSDLTIRSAWLRALVYPLSVTIAAIGLIGIVIGRERRSLHDVVATTTVVYDWSARTARWHELARQRGGSKERT